MMKVAPPTACTRTACAADDGYWSVFRSNPWSSGSRSSTNAAVHSAATAGGDGDEDDDDDAAFSAGSTRVMLVTVCVRPCRISTMGSAESTFATVCTHMRRWSGHHDTVGTSSVGVLTPRRHRGTSSARNRSHTYGVAACMLRNATRRATHAAIAVGQNRVKQRRTVSPRTAVSDAPSGDSTTHSVSVSRGNSPTATSFVNSNSLCSSSFISMIFGAFFFRIN